MRRLRSIFTSASTFRREAAISVVFSFAFLVISAVQGPLLARSLGSEQRGDLAAVYVPFLTFGWLVTLGLPAAAAFYVRSVGERRIIGLAFKTMVLVGFPAALVLSLAAPAYLGDRPHETVAGMWALLAAATILLPVEVAEAMVRGRDGAGYRFNVLRSIRPVLSLLVLIGLQVVGRLTLTTAMASFVVGTLLGGLIELVWLRHRPTLRTDRPTNRRLISFGLRSAGETGALTVVARLDQLILAGAGYRAELGLYSVAATLAQLSGPLSNGVASAILPAMQRAGGEEPARRLAVRATLGVLLGSVAIAGVLALIAPAVLRVAFGQEFEDAATFVWLLLPGQVAYDVGNVLGAETQARGRPGLATQGMVVAAVGTAVLVPFAIATWDVEGAAGVTSFAYVLRAVYLVARWRAPKGAETAYDDVPSMPLA